MKNLIREDIKALKPYTASKEHYDIKLDANESPYNLLEDFKEEFLKRIGNISANRYPDLDSYFLRKRIADYVDFKGENVICGNGSDEIIQMIINSFVDRGEYVVTHSPTFSMYKIMTQICGGSFIEVPSDDDFNIDVDGIIEAANENNAKIIIICNPNNPTGTVTSRENILKIIESTSSIVVVDEAYYEFLGETVADRIKDCSRLVVLRTLSKAFSLAGARVGYGIAGEELINVLLTVKHPYNINVLSETIALLYIDNADKAKEKIEILKNEREYLIRELQKVAGIKVFPSGSNFVLIKSTKAEEILKACKEEKILLRGFGGGPLENCIRITIGKGEENKRVLSIMQRVV